MTKLPGHLLQGENEECNAKIQVIFNYIGWFLDNRMKRRTPEIGLDIHLSQSISLSIL